MGRLGVGAVVAGAGGGQLEGLDGEGEVLVIGIVDQEPVVNRVRNSASKRSIRRFVITEKAPTRAFSWLKAATTAFTFKTLC